MKPIHYIALAAFALGTVTVIAAAFAIGCETYKYAHARQDCGGVLL